MLWGRVHFQVKHGFYTALFPSVSLQVPLKIRRNKVKKKIQIHRSCISVCVELGGAVPSEKQWCASSVLSCVPGAGGCPLQSVQLTGSHWPGTFSVSGLFQS